MRCLELSLLLVLLFPEPAPAENSHIVQTWAGKLGNELWRLSESLTKSNEIRIKYKRMNASVKKKDGKQILESSLRSVSTMLKRKIKAVKCIHRTAENLASTFNYSMIDDDEYCSMFEYCSAKYSEFSGEVNIQDSERPRFAVNNSHYLKVSLWRDSHFYDISVNTNMSCVHVPTNIYYKERDALNAILWSKELNDIFIRNYQADPSLSWQYFGSSRGILRFYPGMPWNRNEVDTYDCRVKSWYIEAATCSKDVVILFDVSGSMTGFKNYVARRTLRDLLSTLSNNDYVNVFTFKNVTNQVVSCFQNLVQATPENIETIKAALEPTDKGKKHKVPLEGNANLTLAYMKAFTTLKEKRGSCNVSSTQGCNQLVMVITDYVPGNLTEVFEEYNREVIDNKTYIPVRVFTYLIGKEVTNVREIQWMACLNRGYFVHIHSVEEVQQQVLKYINVIARPMILEDKEPPPTWTHANIDDTRTDKWKVSGDVDIPSEDKLVTSVAIPAFDYKYNLENNDAILLGVAGTDVPIDSLAKLAQPHQLGVNGYSFIVSNNGYLLLHPLLIATINDKLQENYNSVDFVEVEQVDDGKGPRELGSKIIELRQHLVNAEQGNMTNVEVLFHYDGLRRIARVKHDYFFDELNETPFSMGISLPRGYGDTELLLKDNPLEAKQGKKLTGINVTDYFRFSYRVHPDWVYCKYHYLEGHEAENAEAEIWTFLVRLSENNLNITTKQYDDDLDEENSNRTFDYDKECYNTTKRDQDDYYCNEDLVKQLVFDGKLTSPYFRDWNASAGDWELARRYNVSVRFIATGSGLTRWHYVFDTGKNELVNETGHRLKQYNGSVFGDVYNKSIEETWYKAAVLQHMINKESLVVATNLPVLDEAIKDPPAVINEDGDITITASYAIFYKDGDSETPASVVGFQYSLAKFYERFMKITNESNEELACSEDYNCYVIDSSGYIVLSSPFDQKQIGQFFGGVSFENRLVLQYLINKTVFDSVEVFNYQALCPLSSLPNSTSAGWSLSTPFSVAGNFVRWLLAEIVLLMINWTEYTYADDTDYYDTLNLNIAVATTTTIPIMDANDSLKASKQESETTYFSCDHSITLYILNQTYFLESTSPNVYEDNPGPCHPPFWASYVTKTNLLLLVVKKKDDENSFAGCSVPRDTTPKATKDSTTSREPCHKLDLGGLPRRPLEGCFTYHDKERNITACGKGSISRGEVLVFMTAAFLASFASKLYF